MKAPAPPPPAVIQENGHSVKQEKVLSRHNAIVYIHKDKDWKAVFDKYTPLICSDVGAEDLNARYLISTFVGQEKVLQYNLTSSTKVKIKDSFVRCQNDKMIIGARFKTTEGAQKYHQQLLGILTEISPYAKVNKNIRRGSETSETGSCKDEKPSPLANKKNEPVTSGIAVKSESVSAGAPKRDSVPNVSALKRESCPNINTARRETMPSVNAAQRGSIPNVIAQRRETSPAEEKKADLPNVEDPVWRVFLGLANLHNEELANPQIASIVKSFVLERGGDVFLRQVNDQKISARLVDDLNNLAGQVHAITQHPTLVKPPVKQQKPATHRQASVDNAESTTLDRRSSKNKRRAPAPPLRSKSLQNLVEDDCESSEIGDFNVIGRAKSVGKQVLTSPSAKRKAPGVPANNSSLVTPKRKDDLDKPLPQFVPPPPPNEPPPEECVGCPVGPLSPESAGIMSNLVVHAEDATKRDLTEEHNAVAQLDMVICAEEDSNANERIVTVEEPGTPLARRDIDSRFSGTSIMESDENGGSSCEVNMMPLNIETQSTETSEITTCVPVAHLDQDVVSMSEGSVQEENSVQLQMQQQLLALQEQVSQQQQMLLAAGLLVKKADDRQEKAESPIIPTDANICDTPVNRRIDVNQNQPESLPPEIYSKISNTTGEGRKIEVDKKSNDTAGDTSTLENKFISVGAYISDNTQSMENVVDTVEDLPPPPPELLVDMFAPPVSTPTGIENIRAINKNMSTTGSANIEEEMIPRILDTVDKPEANHSITSPKTTNINLAEASKESVVNGKDSTFPKHNTHETINEHDSLIRTSSVSDTSTELSVIPAAQSGLPKKPMSGLYAKLKARTAAKAKMPINTSAPMGKSLPGETACGNTITKVDMDVTQKTEQPLTAGSSVTHTTSKQPIPVGSIISEHITVTRKEHLKISDPSTKVRRERLQRDSPPMHHDKPEAEDPVSERLKESAQTDTSLCNKINEPTTTSNETASLGIDSTGHNNGNVPNSDTSHDADNSIINTAIVESLKIREPISSIKESPTVVNVPCKIEQPVMCDGIQRSEEKEPVTKSTNEREDINGISLKVDTNTSNTLQPSLFTTISSDDYNALTELSTDDRISLNRNETIKQEHEYAPPNNIVTNELSQIHPAPISKENTLISNNTLPCIQQTAYRNSNLNEVRSKGYHRITFSNSIDLKQESEHINEDVNTINESISLGNGIVLGVENKSAEPTGQLISNSSDGGKVTHNDCSENIIASSRQPSGSIRSEAAIKDIIKDIAIRARDDHELNTKETETNTVLDTNADTSTRHPSKHSIINENCVAQGDTNVNGIVSNLHASSEELVDVNPRPNNQQAINDIDLPTSTNVSSAPKKSTKNPAPAPKPKPLYKSNSTDIPKTTRVSTNNHSSSIDPAIGNTFESPKDRMIRNIQERGTPYSDVSQLDESRNVLPFQQVNKHANENTGRNSNVSHPQLPVPSSVCSKTGSPVDVVDKTNLLFRDVRGTSNKEQNKPTVKPKPKPKTNINNNINEIEQKPATYMRRVSEEPGVRQTTSMKTVGSLNIGFARDSARDASVTFDSSKRGSITKKEPPKTLPKTKIYRSTSTDSTGSNDSSVRPSELTNVSKLTTVQNSIDIDLRSTSVRNEESR